MKYMNIKKRFGATVMAGAVALSMAIPAFAEDPADTPNNTLTITGSYEAIDLAVVVPTTGEATINPYGLPIDYTGGSGDEAYTIPVSGQQIVTAPMTIQNNSSVALAVSATVTGAEVGDAKLVSNLSDNVTTGENAETPKNIVAKFEAFAAPGMDYESAEADLAEAYSELKSENALLTAAVLTDETTTEGTLVLREGADVSDTDTPDIKAQDGSVAYIRLSGEVVKNPTDAWAESDGFTATIAFTFEVSEYVGTVELSAVESVAAGATAKLTVSGLPEGVTVDYESIKWNSSKTASVTVADSTKKPTSPATTVAANTVTGTVTGVKSGSTKSTITVEFKGSDGVTYRGTTQVKCG